MYALQPEETASMSEAEYLAFEAQSDEKHEYRRGVIYAMTGGSFRHNVITVNTSTQFNIQLADRDCTVTSPDMRVHIATKQSYRYPDVTVICGDPVYVDGRTDTISNPVVLVEVLSPSTTLTDYREKIEEYTSIETLQCYLLISQDQAKIERYRRDESGQWVYDNAVGLDSEISVLDCTLALAQIYNKVKWDDDTA